MDRSVKSIREMLRENVARFLEHANGREVIITVTARLVKKRQSFFFCASEKKKKEKIKDKKSWNRNGMIKERIDITMAKNKFFTIHQKWKKQKSNCEVRMRDWDRISGGEEIMLYFENVNIVCQL
ncbi:unnamed protein product [Brugia timori]|uniref:Uncharacterized protein n=1 Tax=Brugia timori TaxID=42155 RepID=A0A0R3RCH2_9BILA|nr:unnamed protein product [Brugia timori]